MNAKRTTPLEQGISRRDRIKLDVREALTEYHIVMVIILSAHVQGNP